MDEMDKPIDEPPKPSERKPWRRPTITTHGDFRKLTQRPIGSETDVTLPP